ncbi:MAG: hypothetical protein EOP84_02400 [Verrucomicrobiaceae bacterium]|nr:MAG: hypothetical protein EOP84_02400 [Verrucomicrobiaceae bacterium]
MELQLYLVLGLATFRSVGLTAIGFVVSLAWALFGIFNVSQFSFYFQPLGVAFVFFAGSLTYFLSRHVILAQPFLWLGLIGYGLSMFILPHTVTPADYVGWIPHSFLLISVAAVCLILLALPSVGEPLGAAKSLSTVAGKYAYPVFLLHITMAVPFVAVFGENRALAFIDSTAATLVACAVLIRMESLIDRLRDSIRSKGPPRLSTSTA